MSRPHPHSRSSVLFVCASAAGAFSSLPGLPLRREGQLWWIFRSGHRSWWVRPTPVASLNRIYPHRGPVSKLHHAG